MNNDPDNGYTVLIVDDDEQHRALEKEILELENIAVVEARYGEEALDILRTRDFDAILMDKNMPVLDGDSTCLKIRQELNLPLIPILMLTGTHERSELVKSLQAGANDFISKPFSTPEVIARVNAAANLKRATDQLDNTENLIFALARMVEAKDEYTSNHCERLAHTASVFGNKLGLNDEDIGALRRCGVLHDIGKLGIPDRILLKESQLDEAEWEVMKTHTTIGYHICSTLKSLQNTLPIILHHHEKYDGSGYPYQLKGDNIPLLAQVFQLVDIFDASSFERPYKPPYSKEQTITVLKKEMNLGWRNPELCKEFIEINNGKIWVESDPGKGTTFFFTLPKA